MDKTARYLALLKRKRALIEARSNLIAFTRLMMPTAENPDDPDQSLYKPQRFHKVIGAALEEVESGEYRRLMMTLGPRHGKTTLASAMFPAWYIGLHPERYIIIATYNEPYSWDLGRRVRDVMRSQPYRQVFPDVQIKPGAGASNRIETTRGGVVFAVGRGSSVTGRGAHCLKGDTKIDTTAGTKYIRDIVPGDMVRSYEFSQSRLVWAATQAVAHRPPARIFRVTTASGRVVEATADHRFYTGQGWRECHLLAPGDALLRDLQQDVRAQCVSGQEASGPRDGAVLLLRGLRLPWAQLQTVWRASLHALRRTSSAFRRLWNAAVGPSFLFAGMYGIGSCRGSEGSCAVAYEALRTLPSDVYASQPRDTLLLDPLQERSALRGDAQQGQPELAGRRRLAALHRGQPEEPARSKNCGAEARRVSVPVVQSGEPTASASPQRSQYRQSSGKSGDSLQAVSQQSAFLAAGVEADIVISVEDTGREEDVFDIQVAGTQCFFASNLLIHNCILLDDPIKDRVEADSVLTREKLWSWYTQVLRTRLMDKSGAIVIIETRWSEDDLIGRLIDPLNPYYVEQEARLWRKIDFPAIAEQDDVLGRKEGEPLWPERFPTSYLDEIRATDPRGFQALYQGRPAPREGAFFRAVDLVPYNRMDDMPHESKLRFYAASDHAVSLDQKADKSCLMVVGIDEQDHIWIMPDTVWMRLDAAQAVEGMVALMKKYKPQFWWAEAGAINKSIGPFLRRRMLEKQAFCAIDPISPAVDKQQRAQAIQARSAMRMVHFPTFTRWWGNAQDEILKFPHGARDDFVDTLSLIGLGLAKMRGRTTIKPKEDAPAAGTFRELWAHTRKKEGIISRKKALQGWL